jgi:hypothetical protein
MKDSTTEDSTTSFNFGGSTPETDFDLRWVGPHLGYLRSGIYHLWNSLPRRMGSPDVYSTYSVMALACGVDLEGLSSDDPKRKFIRKMTAEQCLMIADAVLEDPGGNPSRFNPLALLHRGSSHITLAQSWATAIRLHVKHEHQRHLLVEACVHMNTQAEARRVVEEKEAQRLAAEKRRDAADRLETQRRHQARMAIRACSGRHGRRHAENLRAYLNGDSLPYPYRCTVCGKITKDVYGLGMHVADKHDQTLGRDVEAEIMITPIGADAALRSVGLMVTVLREDAPDTDGPPPGHG